MTLKIWQHAAKENYCNFASFNRVVDTKTSIIQMGPNISSFGKPFLHLQFMTANIMLFTLKENNVGLYYIVDKTDFMTFISIISRKLPDVTFYIIRCHFIVL